MRAIRVRTSKTPQSSRPLRGASMTELRDLPDLRFSHFADAAFARKRGTCIVATQRVFPFQPFKSVVLGGTETVLSLHGVLTRKTRKLPTLDLIRTTTGFRQKAAVVIRQNLRP